MHDDLNRFDRIYIHEDSLATPLVARLRQIFSLDQIEVVDTKPLASQEGTLSPKEFSASKRLLYVCKHPGQFFKRCPGARPGLACCNYFVLNWGVQCDMNCSYCYLQSFINSPVMTLYSNLEDALAELADLNMEQQSLRVGTGETVDSLSLDEITLHSHRLIEFFREYPKWTLEFKTKSDRVNQFLKVPHAGNVVTSWSINPQYVITHEEHGTASLNARLYAAERCRDHDFRISFHIDPMIWHPEWRSNYGELIDQICARFRPDEIPYLSVGALRFQPEQKAMMRERFGLKSLVTRAEMFPSGDGKLRYDSALRQEMFEFVMTRFQKHSADWRIFMCMETPETWLKTTGSSPFKTPALKELFEPLKHQVQAATRL